MLDRHFRVCCYFGIVRTPLESQSSWGVLKSRNGVNFLFDMVCTGVCKSLPISCMRESCTG